MTTEHRCPTCNGSGIVIDGTREVFAGVPRLGDFVRLHPDVAAGQWRQVCGVTIDWFDTSDRSRIQVRNGDRWPDEFPLSRVAEIRARGQGGPE